MIDDEKYTLINGTEADAMTQQVMNLLDELDPLEDQLLGTMTDEETLTEFERWQTKLWWCAELGCTVSRSGLDGYIETDGDTRVTELMRIFNRARYAWAMQERITAKAEDKTSRFKAADAWAKYVKRTQSSNNIAAVVRLWKLCHQIGVGDLNQNKAYLGTPEGVVDMVSCDLVFNDIAADIEDAIRNGATDMSHTDNNGAEDAMVTKRTRGIVDDSHHKMFDTYDKRWDEFVLEIMSGDQEKADYLKRALGYSIYGGNPEEVMFVAYGSTTRNGKGTLLNSIVYALGDYAAAASPDFLLDKSHTSQGDKDEIAMMAGKRLITISEPPEGRRLDESKVKQFTGNDPITTSKKYGHTFTYEPAFTMWMMCNSLPIVSDTSIFASNRIRVIPFERHFTNEEQDPNLKERFRSEIGMATILNWLLDGYNDYLTNGLEEPKSVKSSTSAWIFSSGDDFRRFIDTRCEHRGDARIETTEFMEAYKKWCNRNDVDPMTSQKVTKRLAAISVPRRKSHGKCYFKGIRLVAKKSPAKPSGDEK